MMAVTPQIAAQKIAGVVSAENKQHVKNLLRRNPIAELGIVNHIGEADISQLAETVCDEGKRVRSGKAPILVERTPRLF